MSKHDPARGSLRHPALVDIRRAFLEDGDPLLALSLCKAATVKKEEKAALNLLWARILRWINRTTSALEKAEEALRTAGTPGEKAEGFLIKGLVLNDLLKSTSAIALFDEALAMLKTGEDGLRAEVLVSLGHAMSNLGNQDGAMTMFDEAMALAGAGRAPGLTAAVFAHRALAEFRRSNLERSGEEAARGLALKEDDPVGAAECHRALAVVQSLSGNHTQAVDNYRHALVIFRKANYANGLMRNYLSFGASCLRMSEIDMAEHFFRKAITLAEDGENLPALGVAYSRLGTMYLAQGKHVEALHCFEKDKEFSRDIENPSIVAHVNLNLGRCFFLTDDFEGAARSFEAAAGQFAGMGDRLQEYLSRLDARLSRLLLSGLSAKGTPLPPDPSEALSPSEIELVNDNPAMRSQRLFVDCCSEALAGRWEKAEAILEDAMAVMENGHLYIEQGERLLVFGKMAIARGQPERAVTFLRYALRLAETYGLQGIVKTIIRTLDDLEEETLVRYSLEKEAAKLAEPGAFIDAESPPGSETIVGTSSATAAFIREARAAAGTEAAILLIGETGTGKELVARSIHRWSRRAAKKFVAVNCGAIPRELVESVLFGHIKGAFTGAVSDQKGSIEAAPGGTIFLDEVTELPLMSQVKLLRFLENREIQPLGVAEARKVDVRVIASTNRDPVQSVKDGLLREDLYYRLSVVPIYIPKLEDRGVDVIEIARHFLTSIPLSAEKGIKGMTRAAETWLKKRPWPGNVRELYNVMLRAVIFTQGDRITVEDFESVNRPVSDMGIHFEKLDDVVRKHVAEALRMCDGNKTKAARLLGVHRNTLRNRLEKLLK